MLNVNVAKLQNKKTKQKKLKLIEKSSWIYYKENIHTEIRDTTYKDVLNKERKITFGETHLLNYAQNERDEMNLHITRNLDNKMETETDFLFTRSWHWEFYEIKNERDRILYSDDQFEDCWFLILQKWYRTSHNKVLP